MDVPVAGTATLGAVTFDHTAAVTQIRHHTPGRVYYDRKINEGKTTKEALRALKRRISDTVYRQLIADTKQNPTSKGPGGIQERL